MEYLSPESIDEIKANTRASLSGCGYTDTGITKAWMSEDDWNVQAEGFMAQNGRRCSGL